MYQKASYQHDLYSCLVIFHRIIDNMPVTWCYEVADEPSRYCSTGFPIGCHVSEDGQARDACVTSVRFHILSGQTLPVVYSVPCRVGNYNWGYFLSSLVEQNKCTSHPPGVEGWDKGHECSLKVRHQGWVVRKRVNANPRLKVRQIFNFSCIKMFLLLMVCVVWFHTSSTVKNKKDIYMQQTSLKKNTKLISKFFRLAWSGFLNNAALLLLVFAIVQPSHPSSDSPTHPFILRILAFMSVPVQISDC